MDKQFIQDRFPIYRLNIDKKDTPHQSAGDMIAALRECVESDQNARFIADFDHYSHTRGLDDGELSDNIQDARIIVFCFGIKLPAPEMLGVRPRSIGVADMGDHFVVSYMEAPLKHANDAMHDWVVGLISSPIAA
ncbi:MAG: DUF6858 family protein [Gammaproteobacteria bacterium]